MRSGRPPRAQRPRVVGRLHIILAVILVSIAVAISASVVLFFINRNITPYIHLTSSVRFDTVGSAPFRPETGKQFVIVSIQVRNPTAHTFALAPVVQTYLQDETGARYEMSPAVLENPLVAGEMKPGESRQGEVSYSVPLSAQKLYFHFISGSDNAVTSEIQVK